MGSESSNCEDWGLSGPDIAFTWFAWFLICWFIFRFPADLIKQEAVMYITNRSTPVWNLWLYTLFRRIFGISMGFFYGFSWLIMFALTSTAAFLIWNQEMWVGAPGPLSFIVASWVLAALWFPVFYGWWPYSSILSLALTAASFLFALGGSIWSGISVEDVGITAACLLIPYMVWLILAFLTVLWQPYVANSLLPWEVPQIALDGYDWHDMTIYETFGKINSLMFKDPWSYDVLNRFTAKCPGTDCLFGKYRMKSYGPVADDDPLISVEVHEDVKDVFE